MAKTSTILDQLSTKELELLALVSEGYNNSEMAEILHYEILP